MEKLNKNCIAIIFEYLNECKFKNKKYTEIYLISKYWNNFYKLKFKNCIIKKYLKYKFCNTHADKNYFSNNYNIYDDPIIFFLNYF